jgi:5-methyltetrahydropteroyltriglutamate--homocysteine methyltransferase
MLRSEDRILTTHTGSLPRPAALTSLYVRRSRGEAIDAAELDREGKAAVREVVAKQIAAGVDIPNNGEQQREAFFLYVRHRMSGFGGGWTRKVFADVTHYPAFMAWKAAHDAVNESISNVGGIPEAVGEVRYLDRAPVEAECADFRAALDAVQGRYAEPFMTAPSPGIIAAAMRNAWYDTEDAYLAALGRALQVEYETIVSNGFVLQIDAPDLAMDRSMFYRDLPDREFVKAAEMHVAALNQAIDGIPRDRVRLHCCWGNWNGPHLYDVALDLILPVLYQANVGALSIEFGNPRHQHELEALRRNKLPDHMLLLPGVVESNSNIVEHPEVVARRLEEAVSVVGDRERVIASADCGFGTFTNREYVIEPVVWLKLKALRQGADIASMHLWGRG